MSQKHYNMKKLICVIVFFIGFAIFLFAFFRLLLIIKEYKTGRNDYEALKEVSRYADFDENDLSDEGLEHTGTVDFNKLMEINKECIGWIEFENTDISYPIVQGQDNEFYLTHHFNKKKNAAGSIFMDYINETDFSDPYTILYGHNMKDGSMFAKLNQYESKDFYVENPVFWIYTPEKNYSYEIFSCYSLDTDTVSQLETNLDVIIEQSKYSTGIFPEKDDKILTLMTCNSNGDTHRFFVHAVQVN